MTCGRLVVACHERQGSLRLRARLERAIDDLRIAIASIVDPNEDAADDVFTEKENGTVGVDGAGLQDLLDRPGEAPEAVSDAFESFGWEIRRALRELKAMLVRETVS